MSQRTDRLDSQIQQELMQLLQRDLNGSVLAERILTLAADKLRRERMAAAAHAVARPGAAQAIVDRALELMRQ